MNIVHSLWVSKLRYGLQLCVKVQANEEETRSTSLKALQLTQNRMLRVINGTKIKDRVSIKSMLIKFNLLSVNQLAASIKLSEVWKVINVKNYAISLDPYKSKQPGNIATTDRDLRPQPDKIFDDNSRLKVSKQSFNVDAARLWNLAPIQVKSAPTLNAAKTAILKHVKTLPI